MAHPFEEAGLGNAPFKFIGASEKRGPIFLGSSNGVETWAGAPGQPMGSCAYCGQGIAVCCLIESADGKRFDVGSDCVRKTFQKGSTVEFAVRRALNAAKLAKDNAKIDAVRQRLETDAPLREALADIPHPNAYRAAKGDTRLDWATWMLSNAGTSGRLDVVRYVAVVSLGLGCEDCDCADPTALAGLADECACDCPTQNKVAKGLQPWRRRADTIYEGTRNRGTEAPEGGTKMEMKCGMCGWVRKPQGIFHVCTNPDCVENPASKAAAADRRMTMEAWERDNEDDDADGEEGDE